MNTEVIQSSSENSSSPFPRTMWTVVLEAAGEDTTSAAEAIGKLCVIYRDPILAWLERSGYSRSTAEDLTHSFVGYLLEKNRFQSFEKRETKFRSFLLECLKRFVRGEWRKTQAAKRGAGAELLDLETVQVGTPAEVDRSLDQRMALAVHVRACQRLQTGKYAQPPKSVRFQELRRFIWTPREDVSYDEVAGRLGMTVNHVKKAVFDLRQQYYDCFRAEVAETVSRELVDEETEYLMKLVAAQGPPD